MLREKTVSAKTKDETIIERELTQAELDKQAQAELEAQRLEQERIANLPETKIAQLEEVIAMLLLQGVPTDDTIIN